MKGMIKIKGKQYVMRYESPMLELGNWVGLLQNVATTLTLMFCVPIFYFFLEKASRGEVGGIISYNLIVVVAILLVVLFKFIDLISKRGKPVYGKVTTYKKNSSGKK